MKLKPVKRKVEAVVEPSKKETRSKQKNTLPKDEYSPMFPPVRFLVSTVPSYKDPTKLMTQYLEVSVKRFDDDEAKVHVFIQMYQESDFYTGYLKGKTVYFPLEMLEDLITHLQETSDECDKRKIVD